MPNGSFLEDQALGPLFDTRIQESEQPDLSGIVPDVVGQAQGRIAQQPQGNEPGRDPLAAFDDEHRARYRRMVDEVGQREADITMADMAPDIQKQRDRIQARKIASDLRRQDFIERQRLTGGLTEPPPPSSIIATSKNRGKMFEDVLSGESANELLRGVIGRYDDRFATLEGRVGRNIRGNIGYIKSGQMTNLDKKAERWYQDLFQWFNSELTRRTGKQRSQSEIQFYMDNMINGKMPPEVLITRLKAILGTAEQEQEWLRRIGSQGYIGPNDAPRPSKSLHALREGFGLSNAEGDSVTPTEAQDTLLESVIEGGQSFLERFVPGGKGLGFGGPGGFGGDGDATIGTPEQLKRREELRKKKLQ